MINQETPLKILLDDKHQLKVLDCYGIEHQSLIYMEELSELQKAISKAARYVSIYDIDRKVERNRARLEEKIEEIYAECGDSGFGSTGK